MGGIDKFKNTTEKISNSFDQIWNEELENIVKDACRVIFSEGICWEDQNKTKCDLCKTWGKSPRYKYCPDCGFKLRNG
jgi:hypothetical protein